MKRNAKILLTLFLAGLLLALPIGYFVVKLEKPTELDELIQLDKTAAELLTLTKKKEIEAAQVRMNQLAQTFPNTVLPGSIRIESLHAVTQSILAAKKVFTGGEADEAALLWHATQVRVAIDALRNADRPMWRDYYASYANQMQNLLDASVERELTEFRAQFDENYRLFLAIKPGMSVQLTEAEMNRIVADYELLAREIRKDDIDWQLVRETLRELSTDMQEAFTGKERSAFATLMSPHSPFAIIFSIFFAVSMALAYAAWKKYDGEQANTI
ncbi:sporulation protein YpjB [Brevibacillus fulvus]|uniref:Sporulation protein YpjB n=1 Tax=Brevibacillus fulvus TaxID=1125967 RepID=A0A939BQT6_9BACL|nr:sporulation protein YpjB [Brevibacillus fulvus]MBM7588738.1 sporulation protein YpjB [Brevibacillus fulvus]